MQCGQRVALIATAERQNGQGQVTASTPVMVPGGLKACARFKRRSEVSRGPKCEMMLGKPQVGNLIGAAKVLLKDLL